MVEIAVIRNVLGQARENGLTIEQKTWRRNLPPPTKVHSDWESYYETFRGVELEGLPNVFKNIRNNHPGEKIAALDIMGNGDAYRSLPKELRPNHIFALTLIDDRTPEQITEDEDNGIHIIKGNVTLPSTWRKLAKRMHEVNVAAFNHAFARPLNGIYSIPEADWLVWYIGQNVYNLLNHNGGIFLTEMPKFIDIFSWTAKASEQNLDIKAAMIGPGEDKTNFLPPRPIAKITKHPQSPTTLPA